MHVCKKLEYKRNQGISNLKQHPSTLNMPFTSLATTPQPFWMYKDQSQDPASRSHCVDRGWPHLPIRPRPAKIDGRSDQLLALPELDTCTCKH